MCDVQVIVFVHGQILHNAHLHILSVLTPKLSCDSGYGIGAYLMLVHEQMIILARTCFAACHNMLKIYSCMTVCVTHRPMCSYRKDTPHQTQARGGKVWQASMVGDVSPTNWSKV